MDGSDLKELFGRNLKAQRVEKGYTQAGLAEEIGVSVEYISKLERGLASPSFEIISHLCSSLESSPSKFFHSTLSES
ncbi:helix-turn-helix domain-containing protein [Salinibacter ruber]|uniref:helix-turn-helix domain-containing protein n=1 Tax=Salinibacter ruber TaxID=146919 RepID=UPI003C6E87F0